MSFSLKKVLANPNQITDQVQKQQRRLSIETIFQKYGLIRLIDLTFNKQLSTAFKQIKTKKTQQTLPSTRPFDNLQQESKYLVSIEVIRPKLKGELIIGKSFDVSNLPIKRKKRISIIDRESLFYQNINLIDAQYKNKEIDMERQNIKNLLILQSVQRQKITTPQVIKSKRRISNLYLLCILFVIVLLCIDC